MLITELEAKVRHKYSETSTEYVTAAVIVDYCNEALSRVSEEEVFTKQHLFTAGATAANAITGYVEAGLPTDFYMDMFLRIDGDEATKINQENAVLYAEYDDDVKRYYLRDVYIGFLDTLDSSTNDIYLEYYKYHNTVTEGQVGNIFHTFLKGYESMIINYILSKLHEDDSMPEESVRYYKMYEADLFKFKASINRRKNSRIEWRNTNTYISAVTEE